MLSNTETEILERIILFNRMTHSEIMAIREKMYMKRFKKGEIILREEDTNKFMYIILRGRVKVVQTTEEGKEIVLSIHSTGDTFGEVSLIDEKTSQAQVLAVTDSLISIISKDDFFDLLRSQGKMMENLLKLFCIRFRDCVDSIKMLSLNNASQRIQMLFMKLLHAYGEADEEGVTLKIRLTHSDIANMAGLTRETVTRIMNALHKEGRIKTKARFIHLSADFVKELS